MKKAISVDQLLKKKFIEIPLTGRFRELIGAPEANGTWLIKGPSGHGKTTFLLALAKELTKAYDVIYNSLEEGARKSMQDAFREMQMDTCRKGSIKLLHRESMTDMVKRLQMRRSAQIVIVDSIQYTFMSLKEYKQMQQALPNKLLIFNAHQKGKYAKGALAEAVEFDADVKIDVEGFKAFSRSRASRGILTTPFTIWEEGAEKYWNDLKL